MQRWLMLMLAAAACGRIRFDPLTTSDSRVGDGQAAVWPSFGVPQLSPVSTAFDDWTPELSRNGLHLIGAAYGAGGAGADDLWATTRTDLASAFPAWGLIGGLGTAGRDFGPALSPDNLSLLYGSGNSGFSEPRAIFAAMRADLGSPFTGLGEVTALTGEIGTVTRDPALSADGLTLYFDSDRLGTVGSTDIWVVKRDSLGSPWLTPVNLAEINTVNTERDPFISSDGLTLYFASNRPGGMGFQDLWVTIRPDYMTPFATPRNLAELNTSDSEGNSTISDDGLIMWDTNRPGGLGGTYGYDIWEARLAQ